MSVVNNAFVINASMFGAPLPEDERKMAAGHSMFLESFNTAANRNVFEYNRKVSSYYGSDEMKKMIRDAIATTNISVRPDVVTMLASLAEIRQAGSVMQEYIMANPKIRKLFLRKQCVGFNRVDDTNPNIGWGHVPYERVMSGVVEFDRGDEEQGWSYTSSSASWQDEDTEVLEREDRVDILATWRVAEHLLKTTDTDITDPEGGFE